MKKFVFKLVEGGKDYFLTANSKDLALITLRSNGIEPFTLTETKFKTIRVPMGQFNYEMSLR